MKQVLSSGFKRVQQTGARCIMQDFNPTKSASGLALKLDLKPLGDCRTVARAVMMCTKSSMVWSITNQEKEL